MQGKQPFYKSKNYCNIYYDYSYLLFFDLGHLMNFSAINLWGHCMGKNIFCQIEQCLPGKEITITKSLLFSEQGAFCTRKKEGGGGNWRKKRAIIYVRNALTMTGLIFSNHGNCSASLQIAKVQTFQFLVYGGRGYLHLYSSLLLVTKFTQ